jgi:hypothetical protein
MRTLQFHPASGPSGKLRGKQRYFKRVERTAAEFTLEPEARAWWDLWQYHPDEPGWGNHGWRYRYPHIAALCKVFRTICSAHERFDTPFQTWIRIDGEDSAQDATYLHTPNPQQSPFPFTLVDAEWNTSALTPTLASLLPGLELEVGWTRVLDEDAKGSVWRSAHWISARGIGIPLRAE